MDASSRTVTLTLLFTDIEGSTRLLQLDEQAMGNAVARHDEVLLAAIGECGGSVCSRTASAWRPPRHTRADRLARLVDAKK